MAKTGESSVVSKCAQVLDILTEARKPLQFSDIASETGFVKSSCHRILSVLISEELIEYDKPSRTYRNGSRLKRWSRRTMQRVDIQEAAADEMVRLSDETRQNIALSILDEDSILYIRTADYFSLRFAARTGDRAPLHSTAAGKIFLANLSERKLGEVLDSITLDQYTDYTITDRDALLAELETVRRDGIAYAVREEVRTITGMSMPVRDGQGSVAACLSLWVMADTVSENDLKACRARLAETVGRLSKTLGYEG